MIHREANGLYVIEPKAIVNSDKFRQAAIHFQKYGYYTAAPVSTTAYLEYWREERTRCLEGYYSEDGDWISGYHYFYLNYCPILLIREEILTDARQHTRKIVVRKRDFPDFWDSDYDYFMAIENAEREGKHLVVLKARGKGYSFKGGSMLCRNYFLIKESKNYAIASEMEYLTKDGLLSKAWEFMDFIDQNTGWAKKRQKLNKITHRRASYLVTDDRGIKTERGYLSEIMGVSLKNDPDKAHPYSATVYTPKGKQRWEEIKEGDDLFAPDGTLTRVTETHEFGEGDVYNVYFNDGRVVPVSLHHEWEIYKWGKDSGENSVKNAYTMETKELIERLEKYKSSTQRLTVKISSGVEFNHQEVPLDAYTLGLMLGDGSIGKSTNNQSVLTMKHEDVEAIKEIIPFEVRHENWGGDIRNVIFIPSGRDIYKNLNLYDKRSATKFIPDVYKYNSKEVRLGIVNGLLDTDGSVTKDYGVIEYSTKSKQLAEDFIWVIRSLGVGGKITSRFIKGETYYRCYVYCTPEDTSFFNLPRKKERIFIKKNNSKARNKREYITIDRVEFSHTEKVKCVTVDSKDSLYLIEDFVRVLNSRGKRGKLILYEEGGKFPDLVKAWQIAQPSVERDGVAFGLMIAFGTGGTDQADYEGLKELFMYPDGYNALPLKNIWDDGGGKCGFFVPEYVNMYGEDKEGRQLMDDGGNTDYHTATRYALALRDVVLKGANDRQSIDRYIAEHPFTPTEACLQLAGNIFPKEELIRHLAYVRNTEALSNYKQVGDLEYGAKGTLVWTPATKPRDITKYRLKSDDNKKGQIVIWEHPVDDPPYGLYIAGCDPYDHDQAATSDSLGSVFIYKRFQNFESYYDILVAEFTGRPNTVSEFYEVVRKLLMYYNAKLLYENEKPGLFAHFTNKHCEHLLADQPDIIKDIIKDSKVQRKKGIHMAVGIKDWAELKARDWLNEEYEPGKKNLTKILSEALLEELISYNRDGNFDRVIAFMLVMIYKEELHNRHVKQTKEEEHGRSLFKVPLFRNSNIPKFINL